MFTYLCDELVCSGIHISVYVRVYIPVQRARFSKYTLRYVFIYVCMLFRHLCDEIVCSGMHARIYMYVCMCVCMCVFIHFCVKAVCSGLHVCVYVCIYVRRRLHTCVTR